MNPRSPEPRKCCRRFGAVCHIHRIRADAQCEAVAIFGLGNVALDCARVLLRDETVLGRTDIAQHAQDALRLSAVKRVDIIGRRGPVQVRLSTSGIAGCTCQSMVKESLSLLVEHYKTISALAAVEALIMPA